MIRSSMMRSFPHTTRNTKMPRHAVSKHGLKTLLLVVVVCSLLLCVPRTSADMMMDMPSDPVSGEMVMSTAFEYKLKNGQRLRFASQETLTQFEADPLNGLGEVKMVDKQPSDTMESQPTVSSSLCPVCGMETAAHGGPQVLMKHGEQAIHTCSLFHAHQVHDEIRRFHDVASTAITTATGNEADAAFCSGPGTTMLNGFSFFRDGRMTTPCLLLWFPGWILNSQARYIGGCLLVVLCAMFNEYLLKLRRILRKESNAKRVLLMGAASNGETSKLLRPRTVSASYVPPPASSSAGMIATWFRGLSGDTQHLVHCLLHGFTILLAYMLMLVSMTYDGVLFVCCIVGYVLGYFVFGERRDAVPEIDALSFASA